jgi:hypothetical protein
MVKREETIGGYRDATCATTGNAQLCVDNLNNEKKHCLKIVSFL